MSPHAVGAFFLALAVVAWAVPVSADSPEADALFREGRALIRDGRYALACQKLLESQRLEPAPGTAVNLGDCYEKQGKVASALQAYEAARDLLAAGDSRLGPVGQQIMLLEKRAPRLTIRLARGAPSGATLTRDGRKAEPDTRVPVDPGEHVIVVTSPGRLESRYKITLAESDKRIITVEAGGDDAREPAAGSPSPTGGEGHAGRSSESDESGSSSTRTVGYVLGGLGILGVVVAVPTYFYVSSKAADSRDHVPGAREDGEAVAPVFYGAAGVAIVGLGVGGYLVLTSNTKSQTAVAVQTSPTALSLSMKRTF